MNWRQFIRLICIAFDVSVWVIHDRFISKCRHIIRIDVNISDEIWMSLASSLYFLKSWVLIWTNCIVNNSKCVNKCCSYGSLCLLSPIGFRLPLFGAFRQWTRKKRRNQQRIVGSLDGNELSMVIVVMEIDCFFCLVSFFFSFYFVNAQNRTTIQIAAALSFFFGWF